MLVTKKRSAPTTRISWRLQESQEEGGRLLKLRVRDRLPVEEREFVLVEQEHLQKIFETQLKVQIRNKNNDAKEKKVQIPRQSVAGH